MVAANKHLILERRKRII